MPVGEKKSTHSYLTSSISFKGDNISLESVYRMNAGHLWRAIYWKHKHRQWQAGQGNLAEQRSFRTQAPKKNVWPLEVRTDDTAGLHRCCSPQQGEHLWARNSACRVPAGQCWEGQENRLFETSQSKRRIRQNTALLLVPSHKET